ncbi:helix-turn-helix domain-containing protein [[Eubacterium] cellulosolvens]
MMEVVLRISMPQTWISEVSKETSAKIKLLECIPDKDLGGRLLFEIETESENITDLLKKINAFQQICKLDISPYKKGGYLGTIVTNNCITCRALTESKCFLTYARNLKDAKIEWHIITGDEKSLSKLMRTLEGNGCSVELISKTPLTKKNILTSRQDEIIKIAMEKGYYDYPKKISLRELSKILKISFSNLNEILHRGEKKIIRDYCLKK